MTNGRFGGFWRRFLAYGIDKTILYLVSLILLLIGLAALGLGGGLSLARGAATEGLPNGRDLWAVISALPAIFSGQAHLRLHGTAFAVLYTLTTTLAGMAYFTWFHGTIGRTPGKMLLGLRVIQASGEPMGFGIAFLRWVGTIVSAIPFWLGFIWIAFDGKKQGWHDKIATTLVVRAGRKPDTGPAVGEGKSAVPTPPAFPHGEAAETPPLPFPPADTTAPAGEAAPSGGTEMQTEGRPSGTALERV
jgi:uncharacterized RDD family membrane protein YckC